MNNAFLLLRTLQVGGLFCGVPKIYDRDCRPLSENRDRGEGGAGGGFSPSPPPPPTFVYSKQKIIIKQL